MFATAGRRDHPGAELTRRNVSWAKHPRDLFGWNAV